MSLIASDRIPPKDLKFSFTQKQAHGWVNLINRLVQSGAKPSTVFKKANAILDQIMASDVNPHLACKRGCNYCCHGPVALTQVEASVIAEAVGIEADCSPGNTLTPDEVGDAPCPFLKNNECSIYEHRPMVCRVFGSFDPPEDYCFDGKLDHFIFRLDAPIEGGYTPINVIAWQTMVGLAERENIKGVKDIRAFFHE